MEEISRADLSKTVPLSEHPVTSCIKPKNPTISNADIIVEKNNIIMHTVKRDFPADIIEFVNICEVRYIFLSHRSAWGLKICPVKTAIIKFAAAEDMKMIIPTRTLPNIANPTVPLKKAGPPPQQDIDIISAVLLLI